MPSENRRIAELFLAVAAGVVLGILGMHLHSRHNARRNAHAQAPAGSFSVYVDPLPQGVDSSYAGAVKEAEAFWEKNSKAQFTAAASSSAAAIHVKWVKDGGAAIPSSPKLAVIGLGDSGCGGKWEPYSHGTVLRIAARAIGFAMGASDSPDRHSVMYSRAVLRYAVAADTSGVIPIGTEVSFPTCVGESSPSYSFKVQVSKPIEIVVVPSRADVAAYVENQPFSFVQGCNGGRTQSFDTDCVVPVGSQIILSNRGLFGFRVGLPAQYTLRMQDKSPEAGLDELRP